MRYRAPCGSPLAQNMGGTAAACKMQSLPPRGDADIPGGSRDQSQTPRDIPTAAMNAPSELDPSEVMRIRLQVLEREHRDLDDAIQALEAQSTGDMFTIKRLKKQKLRLKDQIQFLQDQLNPDIIA